MNDEELQAAFAHTQTLIKMSAITTQLTVIGNRFDVMRAEAKLLEHHKNELETQWQAIQDENDT